jgi:hypothetical protein
MISRFSRVCTQDGTWIVFYPITGLSTSGRYLLDAIVELRRLIASHPCAARDTHVRAREEAA